MIKHSVTCDECQKDLTTTDNCEDWRIVLGNESIPPRCGLVTAMSITPWIGGGSKHFCGIECLKKWIGLNL